MQHQWTGREWRLATLMLTALTVLACGNDNNEATTRSTCGDGVVEGRETCDDGNKTAGDGCSSSCRIEVPGQCETGQQDNDHDNVCKPACPATGACSDRGTCSDASGTMVCTCTSPYGGADCSGCATGYVASGDTCVANAGKTCQTARPLDLGVADVTGTTTGGGDDSTPSCISTSAADVVFVFTLNGQVDATFTANASFDAVLNLKSSCAGTDVACNDDSTEGNTDPTLETSLSAGTYYLFVDGYSGEAGSFTLHTNIACRAGSFDTERLLCTGDPCADDPCAAPRTCVASDDWQTHTCTCPAGTIDNGTACVDDPCLPNPCTTEHQTKCTAETDGTYACSCSAGYIDNAGSCIPDPNGAAWTVMVFMNADNDLEDFGYADLEELKNVGSTDGVNLVVQFDSTREPTKRLFINSDGTTTTVQTLGELDMGSYETLADFGTWAIGTYPARHYQLILWDHGDGWKRTPSSPVVKMFSLDQTSGMSSGISISNGDFGTALTAFTTAAGRKLDLIGFDACLMGMWELAEAVRPYADWYNASEEVEPGDGWPYSNAISILTNDPETTPLQLGTRIATTYVAQGEGFSTMAVTRLADLPTLSARINDLADALLANPSSYGTVETVRMNTLSFFEPSMIDLGDFAARLAVTTSLPQAVRDAATGVKNAVRVAVAANETESYYNAATGLAIYLPEPGYGFDPDYQLTTAPWVDLTSWDEFVADFTE